MGDNESAVALSLDEWHIVQEALDVYYYETDHERPGGLARGGRERRRLDRERRLQTLTEIDEKIARATGIPPMLS